MWIYLNGDILEKEKAFLSLDDRAFLFGDGAYEVIRIYKGSLFQAEEHMARFNRSLSELKIRYEDCLNLIPIVKELIAKNSLDNQDALVYLQITRGAAKRSHHFPQMGTEPTVYIAVNPFSSNEKMIQNGVRVRTAPDIRWARCDIKSVNLLPNVLEAENAKSNDFHETVFVRNNLITEGTHCNVFMIQNGIIKTHEISHKILSGITRNCIIKLVREEGIEVIEEAFSLEEFYQADEVFLSGTSVEVLPVLSVDDQIISDEPGPITQNLQKLFNNLVIKGN